MYNIINCKIEEVREMKKEIIEALKFLEDAGYPVQTTEDIHDGYVSLAEAVREILDESGIKYNKETIDEIIKEALEEYKSSGYMRFKMGL
jgi:Ca2+-binding EF-hand superfamily protein